MCFSMSVANDVFSDGNIKGSGCKPETDEMTDVGVKARFQTGTTGNSSNQILKISDSDIARGVFSVFVLSAIYCFVPNLILNVTIYLIYFQITMNQNSKQTWKRIIDIIITILTALVTSITTTSCMG